jgi:hypothetical protein
MSSFSRKKVYGGEFHDKKVLSVGARPRLPPRALVRKKVSFQLISTVYGKNNRVFSATIIADGK